MLRNTFCHLPGVGLKTEQRIWSGGVYSWDDALAQSNLSVAKNGRQWLNLLQDSLRQYQNANPSFFAENLPTNQLWRLFKDFRDSCVYLDIETTGLGGYGDHITTIATYDGKYIRCFIHGINLEEFVDSVQQYGLIITFNGAAFDLPFIERQFNVRLGHAHIDLRYVLKSLGLVGGLKRCEKLCNIKRPGMEDLDGYAAVLLWHEYRRRQSQQALETLLAYNVQDTMNLETLMLEAYNRKVAATPFSEQHRLSAAPTVANPYQCDAQIVEKVVNSMRWQMPFR